MSFYSNGIIWGIVGMLLSYESILYYLHTGQILFLPMPNILNDDDENHYFTSNYYEARYLFRKNIQVIPHAELSSFPISEEFNNLTIDIGVIPSDNTKSDKMLIHISGTHGVEGFAGSAIQSALLDEFQSNYLSKSNRPVFVFIHALNPYGYARLRRWNENNVDLNRNFLKKEEFEKVQAKDPNRFGYVNLFDFINPSHPLDILFDCFWLRTIYYLLRYGYTSLKQTLVTGNYHYPKGLFYGGKQQEKSHKIVSEFLKTKFNLSSFNFVGIMDIHTGLGPSGFDTIFLQEYPSKTIFSFLRKENGDLSHVITNKSSLNIEKNTMSGYNDVVGSVPLGIASLFQSDKKVLSKDNPKIFALTQEFGTLPGILVFKALREEMNAFHYNKKYHLKAAKICRDAFYLHENHKWKTQILQRGKLLFQKCVEYTMETETS